MGYNALDVARWFIYKNFCEQQEEYSDVEGISNLKLQKLLYYAQGCYLALYDEPLFDDDILAWKHGPVVENIYYEYRNFGSEFIDFDGIASSEFSKEAENVLVWVYNEFAQYTAWKLRNMTHSEAPWVQTKQNDVISKSLIKEYFLQNYVEES